MLHSSSDSEASDSNDFVPKLPTIDFTTLNNSTPNTLNNNNDRLSSHEDQHDSDTPGTTTNLEEDDLNTPDNTVNSDLIQYLDQQCHSISPQWTSHIQFPDKSGVMCNITQYSMLSSKNIFILGTTHKQYYFCQDKYPITNGFEGQGFKNLTKDLLRTGILSYFEIFKRGK